jgi:hypothetical protein
MGKDRKIREKSLQGIEFCLLILDQLSGKQLMPVYETDEIQPRRQPLNPTAEIR